MGFHLFMTMHFSSFNVFFSLVYRCLKSCFVKGFAFGSKSDRLILRLKELFGNVFSYFDSFGDSSSLCYKSLYTIRGSQIETFW